MPELPEVEVVRAGLASSVAGRTIGAVHVLHPRPVRYHLSGPDAFASDLVGRRVGVARRRGKYLWLPLDDTDALLVHLGMSGQFRSDDADAPLLPIHGCCSTSPTVVRNPIRRPAHVRRVVSRRAAPSCRGRSSTLPSIRSMTVSIPTGLGVPASAPQHGEAGASTRPW